MEKKRENPLAMAIAYWKRIDSSCDRWEWEWEWVSAPLRDPLATLLA